MLMRDGCSELNNPVGNTESPCSCAAPRSQVTCAEPLHSAGGFGSNLTSGVTFIIGKRHSVGCRSLIDQNCVTFIHDIVPCLREQTSTIKGVKTSPQDCSSCVDSCISRARTDPNDDIPASRSHIKLLELKSSKAYFLRRTFGFAIKSSSDRECIMSSSRIF